MAKHGRKKIVTSQPAHLRDAKRGRKERWGVLVRRVPVQVVLFVLLWIFCSGVWGDVLYQAGQNTYFAFDRTAMSYVLSQWDGFFILAGRFLLLSCKFPWLGGGLMALMLTLSTWLLSSVFGNFRFGGAVFVLPFAFLGVVVWKGLNLYYQSEAGYLFAFLLLLLLLSALAALAVRLLTRRSPEPLFHVDKSLSTGQILGQWIVIGVLYVLLLILALFFRQNARATTAMERMLEKEEYEEMIERALSVRQPDRAVALYYAIALEQTGQLTSRLFDLNFNFKEMGLTNLNGENDPGTEYYAYDANFYAGLVCTSYHACMERFVCDGPSLRKLKRMAQCALVMNEEELAYKYLRLIEEMPFEKAFVERYKPLCYDGAQVPSDPLLGVVTQMLPYDDSFEMQYNHPLFIGYNVQLLAGRSTMALNNALMACLYSKLLDNFYLRLQPLQGAALPPYYEQALAIYSLNNTDLMKPYRVSPLGLSAVKGFYSACLPYQKDLHSTGAKELKAQYGTMYPYYYYFENIPDAGQSKDGSEKGGVN